MSTPRTSQHWFRTRLMRLAGMVLVGFVLFTWYQDMRSEQTEAWLAASGTHGTWSEVFLMGLAVGGILGALCGPVMTDLIKWGKKQ